MRRKEAGGPAVEAESLENDCCLKVPAVFNLGRRKLLFIFGEDSSWFRDHLPQSGLFGAKNGMQEVRNGFRRD